MVNGPLALPQVGCGLFGEYKGEAYSMRTPWVGGHHDDHFQTNSAGYADFIPFDSNSASLKQDAYLP